MAAQPSDRVTYEIEIGDNLITVTDDRGTVTVGVREPTELAVEVRRYNGDNLVYSSGRARAAGATRLSFTHSLTSLVEESDLPEPDKREALGILQGIRLRRPTVPEIIALLTIFDKSEHLRTQILELLRHLLNLAG